MGTIVKRTNPSGKIVYRALIRIKKQNEQPFSESKTFSKRSLAAERIKKREAEIEANPEILHQIDKTVMPTLKQASEKYLEEVGHSYAKNASKYYPFYG